MIDGKPSGGPEGTRVRLGADLPERHVLSVFANIKVRCNRSSLSLQLLIAPHRRLLRGVLSRASVSVRTQGSVIIVRGGSCPSLCRSVSLSGESPGGPAARFWCVVYWLLHNRTYAPSDLDNKSYVSKNVFLKFLEIFSPILPAHHPQLATSWTIPEVSVFSQSLPLLY